MKKAVIYIRVSTTRQADEGVSLDAQRDRVTAWCEAMGYEIIARYKDAGISGSRMTNRPGLQKALDKACKEKAALITYSLSRLARSTKDALIIAERLDKSGADLVSLSEQIDTTTAAGKMVFRMLAVLAEFERDLISERTSAALQHKRAQGFRISRHAPFGYNIEGDRLIENESEQEIIKAMLKERAGGANYQRIADSLNANGVPPKRATQWDRSVVRRVLKRISTNGVGVL